MDPLIRALTEQQEAEGLGNNAFARKLGVNKATWSTVRREVDKDRRSGAIYEAALRLYPALVARVAQELAISNSSDVDAQHTKEVPMLVEAAS